MGFYDNDFFKSIYTIDHKKIIFTQPILEKLPKEAVFSKMNYLKNLLKIQKEQSPNITRYKEKYGELMYEHIIKLNDCLDKLAAMSFDLTDLEKSIHCFIKAKEKKNIRQFF